MLPLRLLAAAFLIFTPVAVFSQQVNILVVAIHGEESAKREWQPTIDFLDDSLPQDDFALIPVIPADLPRIRSMIKAGLIDFVISQPAIYVDLELNYGVSRILTMVKTGGYSQFGSVIVARADSEIYGVEDLRGKTIAGVAKMGFGGWLLGYKELLDNGFDPYTDAQQVVFLGTQTNVVHSLLSREVDAAVIRTGTFEKMVDQGDLKKDDFRVLFPKSYSGFDLQISTPLYPEWAFAKTRNVSNELTKKVALALLSLKPHSKVAEQGRFEEWTFPYDYQPVHNLLKSLRVEPYHNYGRVTYKEFIIQNWSSFAMVTALGLTVFLVVLIWNRRLKREIAVRKSVEQTLQENKNSLLLAASVFSYAGEGIAITDSNANFLDVNEAFTRITGYTRDEIIGKKPSVLQSGRHDAEFYRVMWESLVKNGHWSGEIWNRRKNKELFAEKLSINAVKNDVGEIQHYVAIFSDYTHQMLHKQQMEHLAHYDALTDLPNRALLDDRLTHALRQVNRREKILVVFYLDLDGFKEINDNYGHNAGDCLLITVSKRLKAELRQGDTIARLGGDEFAGVLLDFNDMTDSVPLIKRMLKVVSQPVYFDNHSLHVTASLGVTFYPQDVPMNADQLLHQADQSMYRAKMAGKNSYMVFKSESEISDSLDVKKNKNH